MLLRTLSLLFYCQLVFCQENEPKIVYYAIKGAYVYNNYHGFEIGIIKPTFLYFEDRKYSPYFSADIFFKNSTNWFEPKIGVERMGGIFNFGYKLSLADLTDFYYHSIRIIPEISFGAFGFIYLAYGYNFGILNSNKVPDLNHRFSVTINYPICNNFNIQKIRLRGICKCLPKDQ